MKPIWKKTPDFSTACFISRVSARVSAGGFSQKMGRPRFAAATTWPRWVWVGPTITNASTPGASSSCSGSANTAVTSCSAATSARTLGSGSAIATRRVSGIREARSRA